MSKSISKNQMAAKEKKTVYHKPKLSIPVEVVIEILSWLPFKTLQRFKCVCKLWLRLLSNDSYFGKLHCKRVMAEQTHRHDYEMRENSYFVLQLDESIPQDYDQDFLDEVYECFYGNSGTFSSQKFGWRLNASGFLQQPQAKLHYRKVSICNGLYMIISSNISIWSELFRIYRYFYYLQRSSLILAATAEAAQKLTTMSRHYETHVCVDGSSVLEGQRSVLSGEKVVIGTPGCVFEIFPRHSVNLDCIKEFVLYNADELFARGFKDKIYDIFKLLPRKVRVVVISDRMPREALDIPQRFWNQKAGQWSIGAQFEASEKTTKPSRPLWAERSARVKHDKELAVMKAMWKLGKKNSWNPHIKMHR